MGNVLKLTNVSVRNDNATLLNNINWSIEQKQHWIILGSNGAGKTTLLQLAGGEILPSAGEANVLGENVQKADIDSLKSRIGLASTAVTNKIPTHESVLDFVITAVYGIISRKLEQYDESDEKRAKQLLDAWGLKNFMHRTFASLSDGEKKRVQIVRALMSDPEVLLLDEPTAGLDIKGRETLLHYLALLAQNPKAPNIILVTHHIEEIPANFTHALLLRAGEIVSSGEIATTLNSENISKVFELDITIATNGRRWFVKYF